MTRTATNPHRRWTTGTAPGAVPVLGHAIPLARRPLAFLAALPARGDLVEIRLGPRRAYLVCHPELAQQVLLDPRTFDKGGPLFDKARPLLGDGLATCPWAAHRRQRQLLQPAFQHSRIAAYAAVMDEVIEATTGAWRPSQVIEMSNAMYAMTAPITAKALFRTRIGDRTVAEVQRWLPVFVEGVYRRAVAPLGVMERLPTPVNRRFDRARERLRRVIEEVIRDHRAAGTDQGDVLSKLLSARDEETGRGLDDDEIHDQVMTLLLAGTETTATTLAWTFHLLGGHPQVEARLHAEVDGILTGRPPGFDDVPRLEYTGRVITEALRMYPPAWILSRTTTAETELAGRRLPTGTTILTSPYVLQRDPALFPQPDRFDPDRWLPERAAAVPRGAMTPFGAGNRKCIGDTFAITEATIALAAIASRWRLRPVPGTRIRPKPKAILGTGPLPMVAEPRSAAPGSHRGA